MSAESGGGGSNFVLPAFLFLLTSAQPPINTSGILFSKHVCRVTFKHLPQPLRSHIQSFGTLGQLLKIPPSTPQIYDSPWMFLLVGILLFLLVRSPCKILEPYDNFWISPPCPPKYVIVRGVGILIFLWVRSPCTILEPCNNPFWDFSNSGKSGRVRRLITQK